MFGLGVDELSGSWLDTYMTFHTDLTNLAERTVSSLPTGCNGAGEPSRRMAKVINGHHVRVWAFGFGIDDRVVFEVDGSTKPLNLAEAAEAVA